MSQDSGPCSRSDWSSSNTGSRYVVMPVAEAEFLCREHANYWARYPKKSGEPRSASFPIYLPFKSRRIKENNPHISFFKDQQEKLLGFENRWDLLEG